MRRYEVDEDEIACAVLEAAIEVHRELGPGLLEHVNEVALAYVLRARGLEVVRQTKIPIRFRGVEFEEGFRADLIVGGKVLVEVKALTALGRIHHQQVLTYLKLTGLHLGLLVNFGDRTLARGFHRIVHELA